MPSEEIDARVRDALARPHGAFGSVLSTTVEQARGTLSAQHADEALEAAELGRFATGRIDAARFTSLLTKRQTVEAATLVRMDEAFTCLAGLAADAAEPFDVHVEPGGSVRDAVASKLALVGRVFGAARIFDLARAGRFREEDHGRWLETFPFELWNRSERAVAPPLVVTVNGRDLFAEGLAEFLDGALKIALVVRGDSPRAPLVRLITPHTYVQQTDDPAALRGLGAWAGPGVAALVTDEAAHFTHDPGRGRELWERFQLDHLPTAPLPAFLGGRSAAQQRAELAQLDAYAKQTAPAAPPPAEPAAPAAPAAAADPVDKLAAWLLAQAELEDVG